MRFVPIKNIEQQSVLPSEYLPQSKDTITECLYRDTTLI